MYSMMTTLKKTLFAHLDSIYFISGNWNIQNPIFKFSEKESRKINQYLYDDPGGKEGLQCVVELVEYADESMSLER